LTFAAAVLVNPVYEKINNTITKIQKSQHVLNDPLMSIPVSFFLTQFFGHNHIFRDTDILINTDNVFIKE